MQGALILSYPGPRITPPAELPVAALMQGRPVDEALALLPRLFSLCAAAQGLAFHMALGRPAPEGASAAMQAETRRDHLLKLCVIWPRLLGLPPHPIPRAPIEALGGSIPQDWAAWRASGLGVAPVLAAIEARFAPGQATARLPLVTPETAMQTGPQENSVAARHANHPALQSVAARFGHSPLWHAMGRVIDLAIGPPPAQSLPDGTALVPAARGLFALNARQANGRITAFTRRTPTDHLCAPGGALQQALHDLPPSDAPLVVEILSPCLPVEFPKVQHA